jgi:hypothetical protein
MAFRNVGILPQLFTALQSRRWRQHCLPKRRYPTTALHGITTQKMEATWPSETSVSYHKISRHYNPEDGGSMVFRNVGILPQYLSALQHRRWRQHGLPKRRYSTTALHGITTQKMEAAWRSEKSVSYHST